MATLKCRGQDCWNAFMVEGAVFSPNDIPICPENCYAIPKQLISFPDAKTLYRKSVRHDPDFFVDVFIHFYVDDEKFDGPLKGIWQAPQDALKIFRHFAGIITPDFSTYVDFPMPLKLYNTYRMRAFGVWAAAHGIPIIHNIRWGTEESFSYCFDGIPCGSIVSIGAVASHLQDALSRELFVHGFCKMLQVVRPCDILIYGSISYVRDFLPVPSSMIHVYAGSTAEHFRGRCRR